MTVESYACELFEVFTRKYVECYDDSPMRLATLKGQRISHKIGSNSPKIDSRIKEEK